MHRLKKQEQGIVFIINTHTYFYGLIDLVLKLKERRELRCVFVFTSIFTEIKKILKVCDKNKIEYIMLNQVGKNSLIKKTINSWITSTISSIAKEFILFDLLKTYLELKQIASLLNLIKPCLIVLNSDNIGYNTSSFVKEGHKQHIPSLIIPQWMANEKEAAEHIFYNRRHHINSLYAKFAASRYPQWVYEYKSVRLLRLPASQAIVKELFKLTPPNPWIINSSYADRIAVESKAMLDYALSNGIPSSQLVITGSMAHDIIFSTKSSKSLPNTKRILIALPPDFFYTRKVTEFESYTEFIKYFFEQIMSFKNVKCIISPHPAISKEMLNDLKKYNCEIANQSIAHYISWADVFIASVSSTIQWALAKGIPVLNYDFYGFKYDDYKKANLVTTVFTKSEFEKNLEVLLTCKEKLEQNRMESQSNYWGIIDGKAFTRIESLFFSLLNKAKCNDIR